MGETRIGYRYTVQTENFFGILISTRLTPFKWVNFVDLHFSRPVVIIIFLWNISSKSWVSLLTDV
jgi:hypothetical protein